MSAQQQAPETPFLGSVGHKYMQGRNRSQAAAFGSREDFVGRLSLILEWHQAKGHRQSRPVRTTFRVGSQK